MITVRVKGAVAVFDPTTNCRPAGLDANVRSTVAGSRRRVTVTHPFGVSLVAPGLDLLLDRLEQQILWIPRTVLEIIFMPGTPWTLWNHGSEWAGPMIAGRISQEINKITLDGTPADDYWQGLAAAAHPHAPPPHQR